MNMSQQRQFQIVVSGGNNNNNNNNQYVDTSFTKIFVGGLAWETQRDTMRRYFEQFGEILEAVVITDKHTGRSKGYGFVTFKEAEAAMRACQNPSPVIDGRRANCNLAFLGAQKPPRPPNPHQEGLRSIHAGLVASPHFFHGSSSYIHQPTNQYAFSFPPYGYLQDNIYHLPLSYYGGGYGGHHHQQFSPYYTSGTLGTPGFIPNFYPFYSQSTNQAHGYGAQYPQIVHYPYSPHQQLVYGGDSGGGSSSSGIVPILSLQSSHQIVQGGGDSESGGGNSSGILSISSLQLPTTAVTTNTTATSPSMTMTTTTTVTTTIGLSKTPSEPNSSEQTKP